MIRSFIGLGSNLGRRRHNILTAWKQLTSESNNYSEGLSSPYLSEPVGIASQDWFINAVGIIMTDLSPDRLLTEMLAIEKVMGRDRSLGDDRIIDLDLLYYDDFILGKDNLTVPHPAIAERLFILLPLREVAPEHCHPVLNLTSSEMLSRLNSKKIVKKTTWDHKLI